MKLLFLLSVITKIWTNSKIIDVKFFPKKLHGTFSCHNYLSKQNLN
jgi:hypothetical protein